MTTHSGSLPRPAEFLPLVLARDAGQPVDDAPFEAAARAAVRKTVQKQAEATGMIDLSLWPDGSRLILRKERPHPGAQLTFTDIGGMRVTALLTNTPAGVVPFQAAGLELRHRQHVRVEDRIREAKATGLRNLRCREFNENQAWLRPCSPRST